jgi:hypothetical protein
MLQRHEVLLPYPLLLVVVLRVAALCAVRIVDIIAIWFPQVI